MLKLVKSIRKLTKEILQDKKVVKLLEKEQLSGNQINRNIENYLKNFQNLTINQSSNAKEKINVDGTSLFVQYFQKNMIPQTHWSKSQNLYFSFFKTKNNQKMQEQRILPKQKTQIQEIKDQIIKLEHLPQLSEMSYKKKLSYILDLQIKLNIASKLINSAKNLNIDITTLSRNNCKNVWKHININLLGDQKKLNIKFNVIKQLLMTTIASELQQINLDKGEKQNSLLQKFVFGVSLPRYLFQFNIRSIKSLKFLRCPTLATAKTIINLPQNGAIKQMKKIFLLEKIACNLQFYVPRGYYKSQNKQKIDIFTPKENYIKVRLLNHQKIQLQNYQNHQQILDTIIIHVHGGGFIGLSSCTMQTYTRKWANQLKIPVFSIDYGKPPQNLFPTPVFDCLDAYKFISESIHRYMNIRPKRIILAGDSAGGNIVCSLNGLIMRQNLHQVDSMLLAYPAVDLRVNFSPSKIHLFNDWFLYPTLLQLCIKSYLGQYKEWEENQLANPILLTQSFVNKTKGDNRWPLKWPKSIIMVGKRDPLLDDSLKLCQKLQNSGIQFHCELYKNLPHGFLSLDMLMWQCKQTVKDSIRFLEILINRKSF